MYKRGANPVLSEGTMERFLSKMPMKEIDHCAIGRKTCKINHQEAVIKAIRAMVLWVLLSASLTPQPHRLPDAIHSVSPDCWTSNTGTRLDTSTRWAAETDELFFPQKTAEGNKLTETWKQTSCKDNDCRSCTLAAFCVLFPAPCHLFKSAQDTSRSPLELRFPWLENTGDQFTTE